ncbi:MAG: diaminopimelate epimerase, partial [Saprospiraceae bacterium]|nr:diaminopimelate epimerase [Saprospiraceae bacterium]
KVGEQVSVQLKDVLSVHKTDSDYVLDTGSPHYVSFRNNISELPIIAEARKIRYSDTYSREGINVNFVEKQDGYIRLRTYERGVEDETLSCGTGVTASAIAATLEYNMEDDIVHIEAEGGKLTVKFVKEGSGFRDVWLTGPVNCVYKGEIELG